MRTTKVRTMCRLYSALPRWSVRGRAACAARSPAASMTSAVSGWPVSALTAEGIEQAAELAAQAARPRTDHRGSAEYKRHMVRTFVVRILAQANGADGSAERAA